MDAHRETGSPMSAPPAPTGVARADESVLQAYELAPDEKCSASFHPLHEKCGRVAAYMITAYDPPCDEWFTVTACLSHLATYLQAFRRGGWCPCGEKHWGHECTHISADKL